MTIHEHDSDLIMALAAGHLDPASAERALAEVAGCAACSGDLEDQRAALAALSGLPPVELTELEAVRLNGRLDEALGHVRTVAVTTTGPPRRNRSIWVPMGAAAAVLLALFLVAPALQLLGGGEDDAASDVVAFDELEAESETGDEESARAGGDDATAADTLAEATLEPDLAAGEDAADGDQLEDPVTTVATEGSAVDTTAAAGEPADVDPRQMMASVRDVSSDLRDIVLAVTDGAGAAEVRSVARGDASYQFAPPATNTQCGPEAATGLTGVSVSYTVGAVTLPSTTERVVVTVTVVEETTLILAHAPETCAVVGATSIP